MNHRTKHTWKWLAMAAISLCLVVVFACNSPFIPIPPPDPTFAQDSSGGWAVSTPPDSRAKGATYYIYNANLGSGLIQKASADGSMYAFPLQGRDGDFILIHWERPPSDSSGVICRPLGAGLVQVGCQ